MADLNELQKKLKAVAETVNLFTSEAVQLRVIELLLGELGDAGPSKAPSKVARSKGKPKSKASGTSAENKAKAQWSSSRSSRGPGATMSELLSQGYFKTPRTIGAIIDHCGSARGLHYKPNECSTPLLRLLRDEKLKRAKNKDGQYEYTQA